MSTVTRLAITGLVVAVYLTGTIPVAATATPRLEGPEHGQESDVTRDLIAHREQEEAASDLASGGGGDGTVWVGLPFLRVLPGWEPCIAYDWVARDPEDDVDGERDEAWATTRSLYEDTPSLQGHEIVDCDADIAEPLPVELVRDLVREPVVDLLPRPEPELPPGYALTGMPAYLVTHHDLTYQRPEPLILEFQGTRLAVDVTGQATMYVDWGDGTGEHAYTRPGRPYPDGEVRRAYAHKGTTQLTIVDEWTLDYTVRADGQTIIEDQIPPFRLPPVTHDLDIRELRATRTTPTVAD